MNLAIADQEYSSEFGWVITLPAGWQNLQPGGDPNAPVPHHPIVFASADNWALSLTWMIAAGPVDKGIASDFLTRTMLEGPIDPSAVQRTVQEIFPAIGEINEAIVVKLPDGSKALELLETYWEAGSGQIKRGYQLILPLRAGLEKAVTFQRLCFYAPRKEFSQRVAEVRKAARSFHYVRTAGLGPPG